MAERSSTMEPFGVRLDRLLRAAGRGQAWLVRHAALSSWSAIGKRTAAEYLGKER